MALLYFVYLFLFAGLDGDEKKRIAVILVLFVFAVDLLVRVRAGSRRRSTSSRATSPTATLGGWEMPATWFQSVNSLVRHPLRAGVRRAVGRRSAKRGRDLSSPTKFALGLSLRRPRLSPHARGANRVDRRRRPRRASRCSWLIASYFFQTIGELCAQPRRPVLDDASSRRERFAGQMMGVWFTSIALGNLIAGLVGGNVDPEKLEQMPVLFQRTAVSLFVAAALLLLLVVPIRRMLARTTR